MSTVTLQSVVRSTPEQMTGSLGDSSVLLHIPSQRYFSIEGVGADVVEMLHGAPRVQQVVDAISARYDVPRATCERDVLRFVRRLVEEGLATVVVESSG